MTSAKLVIVGAGRMGGAVLTGALSAGVLAARDVGIWHTNALRAIELAERYGVRAVDDDGLAAASHVLLGIKPQALPEISPLIARRGACFISLLAGVSIETLHQSLHSSRIIRAMPNLGARVGLSSTALAASAEATGHDTELADRLFRAVGSVWQLPEQLFDAFTGLAGSGPAFAAVIAEALADGGVRSGLQRPLARELAREVLLATAMLLEADTPAALKDEVASPGGTAIAGVRALEQHGMRFSLIEAVEQASRRASELNGRRND